MVQLVIAWVVWVWVWAGTDQGAVPGFSGLQGGMDGMVGCS